MNKSYYVSTFITALLLFILGTLLLLVLKGQSLSDDIKSSAKMIVELEPKASNESIQKIKLGVGEIEEVLATSIEFVSKEEAYQELFDNGALKSGLDTINPFLDIIIFNIQPDKHNIENIDRIEREVLSYSGVANFIYENTHIQNIEKAFSRVKLGLSVFGLVLMLIVIILLHNIIKLMLMNQKKKIEIMELVGATHQFIRAPFLYKAMRNGVYSGVIASVLLSLLVMLYNFTISNEFTVISWLYVMIVAFSLVLIGFAVSLLSTYIIVNLYLKNLSKI